MKTTPNHPSIGWIAGLFALMAFLPFRSVEGQTTEPQTITLCVTPFGAVYLIQQPGLPDACRSDEHVEIALQVAASGESPQAAPPPGIGPPPGAGAKVVKSLNALSGDLTLTGLGGTTISDDGLGGIEINTFSGNHADLSNVLPDQHHIRYADDDAVAAMGAKADANALNHDRYTDAEAIAAAGGGVSDHGALTGLTDDDHSQYVLADGVRSSTNGFAVTGALFAGTIPTSGPGPRIMWYPGKAAFRVGSVDETEWDDANIGMGSTATGFNTTASGAFSTAMGVRAIASEHASTAMGQNTTASGLASTAMGDQTTASGDASTAMGIFTIASGVRSTAIGQRASTNGHEGSFVYGDKSTGNVVNVTADNSFVVRAAGGTTFYSNPTLTAGVSLASGAGAWASVSDRNRKHLFRTEDGESVLGKIAGMPIPSWAYKAQDTSIRHVGPMAQDFYAAFGLGQDTLTITTSDISGVNMLAIQALEARTRDLDDVRAELAETRQRLAALQAALARLDAVTEVNER